MHFQKYQDMTKFSSYKKEITQFDPHIGHWVRWTTHTNSFGIIYTKMVVLRFETPNLTVVGQNLYQCTSVPL